MSPHTDRSAIRSQLQLANSSWPSNAADDSEATGQSRISTHPGPMVRRWRIGDDWPQKMPTLRLRCQGWNRRGLNAGQESMRKMFTHKCSVLQLSQFVTPAAIKLYWSQYSSNCTGLDNVDACKMAQASLASSPYHLPDTMIISRSAGSCAAGGAGASGGGMGGVHPARRANLPR